MTDSEALTLRVTVIGGERCANDYQVIWRGMPIGRIRRTSDVSGAPQWVWNCYLRGRPCRADESGDANGLDNAKAPFRKVWEGIRAGLTGKDIARAHRYAEASAEALARYDRKVRSPARPTPARLKPLARNELIQDQYRQRDEQTGPAEERG